MKTRFLYSKRMLMVLSIMMFQQVYAQNYPKGYFRSPLDIPLYLSGSFGELRANHFHTGLDIKTQGVEGLKVYAVADGYVSRIRVSHYGYGLVMYINHPNGYTSVYAHLSQFNTVLGKYVKDKQYELQTEEIDLDSLPEGKFPVKKGEVIALSGNSGSSGGPHLHFEIRETATEKALNPWLFGFDIKDDVRPTIHDIKIYPLSDKSVISGQGQEKTFLAKGSNGHYQLKDSVVKVRGEVGFAIHTIDLTTGSGNLCGVYEVELYMNDSLLWKQQMSCIDFSTNRYINAHMDYLEHRDDKSSYHKSFISGNNQLEIYPVKVNNGWVTIKAGERKKMKYVVKDIKGNLSQLNFTIESDSTLLKTEKAEPCKAPKSGEFGLFPIHWDHPNVIKFMDFEALIPIFGIYENQCVVVERLARRTNALSFTYKIGDPNKPMQDYMEIALPTDSIADSLRAFALAVYINGKGRISSEGGKWENGHLNFKTRSFGSYAVMLDTVAPVISPVNISEGKNTAALKELQWKVADNLSGVAQYSAFIDGKWILLHYNVKKGSLHLNLQEEKLESGSHRVEIVVKDERGNRATFACSFTR
ncbi:MAG: M23 family metallopeptidase [Flavobacteriales bacterium]|nr:M23 family metallopeptidase [Flavobacteriales bacterium]